MSEAGEKERMEQALTELSRIALKGAGTNGFIFYANDVRQVLARYAAQERLEEAKWWEHLAQVEHENAASKCEPEECPYCKRIAQLERAAAGG